MKTTEIAGKSVVFFDSIEELPIRRFHRYNKMVLLDSGIGSDLNDIDTHISRTIAFIAKDEKDEAVNEMQNLRQNIYFIHSNISPHMLACATLIKSIDGKECDDLSDDGLKATIELLADVPYGELTTQFREVKKKITDELTLYFRAYFDNSEEKEYYGRMHAYTMSVLDRLITGEDHGEENKRNALLTFAKPRKFYGVENAEIAYEKTFEKMCALVTQNLHIDAKGLSVLEFYSAVEHLEEQAKEQKKATKRQ